MTKQYLIIGSGPAGVSAATALLDRGLLVTMLDAGIELEQSRKDLLTQLQAQWDEKLYQSLKHHVSTKDNVKYSYGSDYPYQQVSRFAKIKTDKHTYCMPSFARGGLSNLWGAYVAPYNDEDMQKWPIKQSELAPYFQQITKILPISSEYQCSKQANYLLQKMEQHKTQLQAAGFSVKPADLAVNFNHIKNACFYCGNCQHGCPNGLIYSARDTLKQLLQHPKFTYIKNIVVEKIVESENYVTIFSRELTPEKNHVTFKGDRVFLAAGAIFSTKILLNSLDLFDQPISLKDSQHFMLPCLMKKTIPNVEKEKLHTLTQLSLRLRNVDIASHPIHLQIYTFMDHYTAQFRAMLKGLYPIAKPLLKPFINRMIVIQGFFHSEDSPGCTVQLAHDAQTLSFDRMHDSMNSREMVKDISCYLKNHHEALGFTSVGFMSKLSKVLRSYHYGGSFPMQASKRSLTTTDVLGRPYGMEKLHVVDATVFPTIPAQSIMPTIMANAYRIATDCP